MSGGNLTNNASFYNNEKDKNKEPVNPFVFDNNKEPVNPFVFFDSPNSEQQNFLVPSSASDNMQSEASSQESIATYAIFKDTKLHPHYNSITLQKTTIVIN